jgi:hypothetical protein
MNGGHHSDHHRSPARAYPRLGRDAAAPELPLGYAGTMAMALVPPLWRACTRASTGWPRARLGRRA